MGEHLTLVGILIDTETEAEPPNLIDREPDRLSIRLDFAPIGGCARKYVMSGNAGLTDLVGRPVRLTLEAIDE